MRPYLLTCFLLSTLFCRAQTDEKKTSVPPPATASPVLAQKSAAAVACPPNLDFESGNLNNWSCFTGTTSVSGTTNQVNTVLSVPLPDRHNVYATGSGAVDPFGLFPVSPANGSGYAVKLGNSQVGAQAEKIRYVINVPYPANDYSITFQYALVFENPEVGDGQPLHAAWEQPQFTAKMYDPVTNEYLPCASFSFTSSNVPGFLTATVPSTSPSPATVKYKPWSSVYVNLSKYAGKTLYLEFTTADCTVGNHFGYAYVDVLECGVGARSQYNCLAPNVTTLTAPPGFETYKWFNSSFSTQLGTGQNLTLSPGPAPGTDFWAVVKPFDNTGCTPCDCSDTLKVTVSPNLPVSNAGVDLSTCAGTSVTIGSPAQASRSYLWSPATGLTNPTAATTTANPNTTMRYILTTTDITTGCSSRDTTDVTVNGKPLVSFTVNRATQCLNDNSFIFTNNSSSASGALSYQWNFGDSSNSVVASPAHTYGRTGTFTVKLYATSANGCVDSTSTQVTVIPSPNPDYTINNPNQCHAGNSFLFSASSPGMSSYTWDIGGFSSIQRNPLHSFAQPGNYLVKLLVTATNGCKDSAIKQVNVYPQPLANYTINNAGQCVGGNNFILNNTSVVTAGSMIYNWDFGDNFGTSTATNPVYSYSSAGSYTIRLVATTNNACVDSMKKTVQVHHNPMAAFTINSASQCLPTNNFDFTNASVLPFGTMSYEWDFGDGTYSNQTNPTHSYVAPGSYMVKLTGTSNNGCTGSINLPVSVFAIPQVSIAPTSLSFCNGDTATITATASAGSGSILRYTWYKDAAPAPGFVGPAVAVTQSGTYELVVTNTNGCSNRSSAANVIVHPLPTGSILPPASTTICEGSGVLLEVTPGSNYQWYFNSNPITSAVTNSIIANNPGTYSVRLSNQFGCTSMASNTMVLDYVSKPAADFTFNERCTNIPLKLNNLSNVSGSGPIAWSWDFGNGTNSNVFNPEPTYAAPGVYPIKLKVSSTICTDLGDSITKYIHIVAPPAGVRYPTVNTVLGTPQQLQARDIGTSYSWRPPVGLSNANVANPIFTNDFDQEYQVRIKLATGCMFTDTVLVRVHNDGDVYVPRAWSPNNDGRNDKLYPILVGLIELKMFRVYNRWGQLMFETRQPKEGWNGIAAGQAQASDTYTWILEAVYPDGRPLKKTGSSILIR